ncbi:MAG: hypothetical protein VYD19_03770 [Myxococcota bacterium]|nr:hypothetical protein [Myxococcota bacterium]
MREARKRAPRRSARSLSWSLFREEWSPRRRTFGSASLTAWTLILFLVTLLFALQQEARWERIASTRGERPVSSRSLSDTRQESSIHQEIGSSHEAWLPELLPLPERLSVVPKRLKRRRMIIGEFLFSPHLQESWEPLVEQDELRILTQGSERLSYESGCFGSCDGEVQLKESLATALLQQLELFQQHGYTPPTVLSSQVIRRTEKRQWLTVSASLWLPEEGEQDQRGRLIAWWLHWSPAWFNALRCQRTTPYTLPESESRFHQEWREWLQESELACDPQPISAE